MNNKNRRQNQHQLNNNNSPFAVTTTQSLAFKEGDTIEKGGKEILQMNLSTAKTERQLAISFYSCLNASLKLPVKFLVSEMKKCTLDLSKVMVDATLFTEGTAEDDFPLTQAVLMPNNYSADEKIELLKTLRLKNALFTNHLLHGIGETLMPLKLVKYLIEEVGLDFNTSDRPALPFSPLPLICKFNHMTALKYFVEERGVDILGRLPGNNSLVALSTLDFALNFFNGDYECIKFLLKHKATVKFDPHVYFTSTFASMVLVNHGKPHFNALCAFLLNNSDFEPACNFELDLIKMYYRKEHPKLQKCGHFSDFTYADHRLAFAANFYSASGCGSCGKSVTAQSNLCSGCRKICYCSRECQALNWKEATPFFPAHKSICKSEELKEYECVHDLTGETDKPLRKYYFDCVYGRRAAVLRPVFQSFRSGVHHNEEMLRKAHECVYPNAEKKTFTVKREDYLRQHYITMVQDNIGSIVHENGANTLFREDLCDFFLREGGIRITKENVLKMTGALSVPLTYDVAEDLFRTILKHSALKPDDAFVCPCVRKVRFLCHGCCKKSSLGCCSSCEESYCSNECFVANWENHRAVCNFVENKCPGSTLVNQMGYFFMQPWQNLYLIR